MRKVLTPILLSNCQMLCVMEGVWLIWMMRMIVYNEATVDVVVGDSGFDRVGYSLCVIGYR